jgi:multicomponent Na+:H+ antiporter subunit A
MLLGPALLAVLGLALGVAPGLVERMVAAPAAAAVLGRPSGVGLALWHGVNPALGLSVLSVALGAGLYLSWPRLRRTTSWMEVVLSWGPGRFYDVALATLNRIADVHTSVLQNGYLRVYLLVVISAAVGLGWFTLLVKSGVPATLFDAQAAPAAPASLYQVGLGAIILAAALVAATSASRLTAVAALGVVGYGVAMLYILYGAPDLAMTQFMVETLTVILFVLAFYHLPRLRGMSRMRTRLRDAAAALVAGGFVTALVLAVTAVRADSRVAASYAEQSLPLGHGRNIVNVILVDFRALDTLGEITVLAVAAFGVFLLLRLRPPDDGGALLPSGSDASAITGERGTPTSVAGGGPDAEDPTR